jgi:hypothetical protein
MSEKEVKVKFSTLYIVPKALKRVMYYARAADGEVSGLGTIVKDPTGRYIVDDVYLLEQESSAADTELNPESISKLMTDMMKKNEDPSRLKFWWHSHASMGVFWSGTDDTCAETLSREFAFSLVVNKAGEKLCRLDIYNPIRITFNHIKLEEIAEEDKDLKTMCELEVKEKVKTPSYSFKTPADHERGATGGRVYPHGNPYAYDDMGYGGYGHNYGDDWNKRLKKNETSKITLPDEIVKDIERFVEISTRNVSEGGSLSPRTWEEYALETLKEVLEHRFEKKAACRAFATWDESYTACGGSCKCTKICKQWTAYLAKKTEELEGASTDSTVEAVEEEAISLDQNSILD